MNCSQRRIAISAITAIVALMASPSFAVQNNGSGTSGRVGISTSTCGCLRGAGTCTQSQVGGGALYCTKEKGDTCNSECGFITSTSKVFAPATSKP